MSPDEFRALLGAVPVENIVSTHITNDIPGPFVSPEGVQLIIERTRATFRLPPEKAPRVVVVGSAKLGFAITEKRYPHYRPRYRPYVRGESDIDIALVGPHLYGAIWSGLAQYGAQQNQFPWQNKLAPHMFHGWIRPDRFSMLDPPQVCTDWHHLKNAISSSEHFRESRPQFAIYHSMYFLNLYQHRAVRDALTAKEMQ